jgi:hypothetical protein
MKTVTAIVPTSLADSIAAKVKSIFPADFIAQAKDALTKGSLDGGDVFCFSGTFKDAELATFSSKGFALPGVIYWVHEGESEGEVRKPVTSPKIIASSVAGDIGKTKTPKELIASSGVKFPSALN